MTTFPVSVCPAAQARKPHGQHRIGVGEPVPCVAKLGGPYQMHECGKPCEYLTEAQAKAEGLPFSGWYHLNRTATADHHAVPRSWVA